MRTVYKRFLIAGDGTVTDRQTGVKAGVIWQHSDGSWFGAAETGDGQRTPVGPWRTAGACADAVHSLSVARADGSRP